MALEAVFTALLKKWTTLSTRFDTLGLLVEPLEADNAIARGYGDAVIKLNGIVNEACAAIQVYQRTSRIQISLVHACETLISCQERFNRTTQQFSEELMTYDRIEHLMSLPQSGRASAEWVDQTKTTLRECEQALYEINRAFLECWTEISERIGTPSVSVHATNIGQQITVRENEEVAQHGIT